MIFEIVIMHSLHVKRSYFLMEKIDLKYPVGSRRAQGYLQASKGFANKISLPPNGNDAVTLNLAHDRALWILDLRQSLREKIGRAHV